MNTVFFYSYDGVFQELTFEELVAFKNSVKLSDDTLLTRTDHTHIPPFNALELRVESTTIADLTIEHEALVVRSL